jgi:acetamidase/formamidase
VTATETNLTGVFRFTVRKNIKLRWPRAETPTHYITMGLHRNLDEAARRATKEMIEYLIQEHGLSRDERDQRITAEWAILRCSPPLLLSELKVRSAK